MTDLPGGSRSDRLERALQRLLSYTPEIEGAAVVSFDGLPMASVLPASMDEDRVAAMSAALLSLGERAAAGLGRGELSQVYIEGDTGTVFLVSADSEAVLVAVAAKGAKIGLMLYEVRRTAAAVAAVLRAQDPLPEPRTEAAPQVPATPDRVEALLATSSPTNAADPLGLPAAARTEVAAGADDPVAPSRPDLPAGLAYGAATAPAPHPALAPREEHEQAEAGRLGQAARTRGDEPSLAPTWSPYARHISAAGSDSSGRS